MSDVAVYIPCFNAEKTLASCVESVLDQQSRRLAEVLVVDDGSQDATAEIASRFPVRVISHRRNRGLAASRNTAIASLEYELIASVDSDCLPTSTWLERLAEALESGDYAAAGGKLTETETLGLPNRWRTEHMSQDWGPEILVNPPFMFGNNLLVRKSIVERIGGFDERFKTNGEDADFSGRLYANGLRAIYTPRAEVGHLRTDTVASVFNSVWTGWRFGAQAYFRPSAGEMIRNMLSHFVGRHFTKILLKDVRKGNLALIPLDLVLPFYLVYRDFQLVLGEAGRET